MAAPIRGDKATESMNGKPGEERPTQRDHRGITVKDFVQTAIKEGRAQRENEHAAMLNEAQAFLAFTRNSDKNCFSNVPLLDSTRVQLKEMSKDDTDYIHASMVTTNLYNYVLVQEVMSNTANDMWRLIWQEKVRVIVNLQTGQSGDQSVQWYKTHTGTLASKMSFNAIKVRTMDVDRWKKGKNTSKEDQDKADFIVYTLRVKHDKKIRKIYVVHFQSWKVDGLPAIAPLLDCMEECWRLDDEDPTDVDFDTKKKSRKEKPKTKRAKKKDGAESDLPQPAMIIQCDSGVKRSGTYGIIDNVCRSLKVSGKADVVRTMKRFRKCRYGVMQHFKHYCFVYQCIMAYAARNNLINEQCPEYKRFKDEIRNVPAEEADVNPPVRTGPSPKCQEEED